MKTAVISAKNNNYFLAVYFQIIYETLRGNETNMEPVVPRFGLLSIMTSFVQIVGFFVPIFLIRF